MHNAEKGVTIDHKSIEYHSLHSSDSTEDSVQKEKAVRNKIQAR